MKLAVYLDFKLPSWLALRGIERLQQETGIDVEWHAFSGSLGNITKSQAPAAEADPLADYKARRARARQMANEREYQRQCEMLGLDAATCPRNIDARHWLTALEWVSRAAPSAVSAYLEGAYSLIYRENTSAEPGVVTELLKGVGCPLEGFDAFALTDEVNTETWRDNLIELGILAAPTLALDDEIFMGREHLPLISWILNGRKGNPPV